jgi:hypothetical protein
MYIAPLATFINAYRESSNGKANSTTPATVSGSGVSQPYVTISSAGRLAAYAEKSPSTEPNTQSNTSETSAVGIFAIPKWLADYGFEVPSQLWVSGNWFAEKYPKAANASPALLAEYSNRLDGDLQTVLSANGIKGLGELHNALITNEKTSEQIRQQLAAQIQNDPRMVDMMLQLGKTSA